MLLIQYLAFVDQDSSSFVDELRVWRDDLTSSEQVSAYLGTSFNTGDQVLYVDFTNVQSLSGSYTFGPSLTLSGP